MEQQHPPTLPEMCSTDCAVVVKEVTAELLTSLLQTTGLEHKALNTRPVTQLNGQQPHYEPRAAFQNPFT